MDDTIIYEDNSLSGRVQALWRSTKQNVKSVLTVRKPSHPTIKPPAERQKVSWKQLNDLCTFRNALLCLPSFCLYTSVMFVISVSVPFYGSLGVSSDLLLLFVALSRAFEALLDPFIVQWFESSNANGSNTISVMQKARVCFLGCVGSGVLLGLHFSPPVTLTTDASLLGWFAWTYIFFFISVSFVAFPVSAMVWSAFRYEGAKDHYKRSNLTFVSEMLQSIGLALVFVLSGYTPVEERANKETTAAYASCYSESGVGKSCMAIPDTGKYTEFQLFNATEWASNPNSTCHTWNGNYWDEPHSLYSPINCQSMGLPTANNTCIQQYCSCVSQCTNLHFIDARRVTMSAAGWMLGCGLIVAVTVLLVHIHGVNKLTGRLQSRGDNSNTNNDGDDDAEAVADSNNDSTVNNGGVSHAENTKALPEEPLIPKIVNLFRNKVVRSFLIPWFLDWIIFMCVIGTVGYYIRAVIKPEYSISPVDCNASTPVFGDVSSSWRCQERAVSSLLLALIMLTTLCSGVIWHILSQVVGTVRAWQLGSVVSFLSILAMVFSAKRYDVSKAIGLGMLSGVGLGSHFLSEVVVIDVIHYYEFISGYQYQHTFAMFKLQFLKISVVIMQILPVALFYEVGFNPNLPAYVNPVYHNGSEEDLAQVFTVAIPCVLCVISFFFKMHFRLVDDEQFDLTAAGIKLLYHPADQDTASSVPALTAPPPIATASPPGKTRKGRKSEPSREKVTLSALDPTSGIQYPAENLTFEEMKAVQLFAHFPDTQNTLDYHSCATSQSPYIGVDLLINRMRDVAAITFFSMVALAVGMVFAVDLLTSKSGMLFFPLIMIMMMGWMLFACYCSVLALQAAIMLKDPSNQPSVSTLDKIIANIDVLTDIALVQLPTREVLRRVAELRVAGEGNVSTHFAGDKNDRRPSKGAKVTFKDIAEGVVNNRKSSGDRASKEVKDLLAAEAYKASIPSKEMEVIEWEQALFRAAKRALTRSKVPTQKTLKLVKTLQKSSKLNFGGSRPVLTRWEAEFYSCIAAQYSRGQSQVRRHSQSAASSAETKSSHSSGSIVTADSSGSDGENDPYSGTQSRASRKNSSAAAGSNGEDSDGWDSDLGMSLDELEQEILNEEFGNNDDGGGVHGVVHSHTISSVKYSDDEEDDEGFDPEDVELSSEDPDENDVYTPSRTASASAPPSATSNATRTDTASPIAIQYSAYSSRRSSVQPENEYYSYGGRRSSEGNEDDDVEYSLLDSEEEGDEYGVVGAPQEASRSNYGYEEKLHRLQSLEVGDPDWSEGSGGHGATTRQGSGVTVESTSEQHAERRHRLQSLEVGDPDWSENGDHDDENDDNSVDYSLPSDS